MLVNCLAIDETNHSQWSLSLLATVATTVLESVNTTKKGLDFARLLGVTTVEILTLYIRHHDQKRKSARLAQAAN